MNVTFVQEPDIPDLMRMIVSRLLRNGIDYEDGGVIILDLYADAYGDVEQSGALH